MQSDPVSFPIARWKLTISMLLWSWDRSPLQVPGPEAVDKTYVWFGVCALDDVCVCANHFVYCMPTLIQVAAKALRQTYHEFSHTAMHHFTTRVLYCTSKGIQQSTLSWTWLAIRHQHPLADECRGLSLWILLGGERARIFESIRIHMFVERDVTQGVHIHCFGKYLRHQTLAPTTVFLLFWSCLLFDALSADTAGFGIQHHQVECWGDQIVRSSSFFQWLLCAPFSLSVSSFNATTQNWTAISSVVTRSY